MLEILKDFVNGAWWLGIILSVICIFIFAVHGIAYLLDTYRQPTLISMHVVAVIVVCCAIGRNRR